MDLSSLLTGKNAAFAAGLIAVVSGLRAVFPYVFESKVGARLLPLLPMVLGVAGAFLLGGHIDATTVQTKVGVGLLAGLVAAQSYKIGRTTVAGKNVSGESS
jgi:hypothetical protein